MIIYKGKKEGNVMMQSHDIAELKSVLREG